MKGRNKKVLILLMVAVLLAFAFSSGTATAGINSTFLYNLSNFSGKIPYNEVRMHVDRARDEVYVIGSGIVKIFNEFGMEVFCFGDDPALGAMYDIGVDEKGDIFILSYDLSNAAVGPKFWISRCNYRGEWKETIRVSGLSEEFSDFFPNRMFLREGGFFLASTNGLRAIVTDKNGVFRKGYDFARILDISERERPDNEIFGISLDKAGNVLFTIPVMFKAFIVSPEGKLAASFGRAGSSPGKFGIVSGIVMDDNGNYLVVERLRSAVMVFDKQFQFIKEFGYFGEKPGNLIRPHDLAVGNSGKIYVTQVRNKGVSVFSVTSN